MKHFLAEHIACSLGILSTDAINAVEVTTVLKTDQLIVGRKYSSPVDHWQRVQIDNVARFTIQVTERCEAAQTASFMFNPGSKQITGGQ